jgi:uncharacterized protein (TIGR02266 family)
VTEPLAESRRRYQRRTVRVHVDYVSETDTRRDTATTLGPGGLFVQTDRPLPRGSSVELRFRLPGRDWVHEIQGRVSWCRPPAESGSYASGMGIQFTDRIAAALLAQDLRDLD